MDSQVAASPQAEQHPPALQSVSTDKPGLKSALAAPALSTVSAKVTTVNGCSSFTVDSIVDVSCAGKLETGALKAFPVLYLHQIGENADAPGMAINSGAILNLGISGNSMRLQYLDGSNMGVIELRVEAGDGLATGNAIVRVFADWWATGKLSPGVPVLTAQPAVVTSRGRGALGLAGKRNASGALSPHSTDGASVSPSCAGAFNRRRAEEVDEAADALMRMLQLASCSKAARGDLTRRAFRKHQLTEILDEAATRLAALSGRCIPMLNGSYISPNGQIVQQGQGSGDSEAAARLLEVEGEEEDEEGEGGRGGEGRDAGRARAERSRPRSPLARAPQPPPAAERATGALAVDSRPAVDEQAGSEAESSGRPAGSTESSGSPADSTESSDSCGEEGEGEQRAGGRPSLEAPAADGNLASRHDAAAAATESPVLARAPTPQALTPQALPPSSSSELQAQAQQRAHEAQMAQAQVAMVMMAAMGLQAQAQTAAVVQQMASVAAAVGKVPHTHPQAAQPQQPMQPQLDHANAAQQLQQQYAQASLVQQQKQYARPAEPQTAIASVVLPPGYAPMATASIAATVQHAADAHALAAMVAPPAAAYYHQQQQQHHQQRHMAQLASEYAAQQQALQQQAQQLQRALSPSLAGASYYGSEPGSVSRGYQQLNDGRDAATAQRLLIQQQQQYHQAAAAAAAAAYAFALDDAGASVATSSGYLAAGGYAAASVLTTARQSLYHQQQQQLQQPQQQAHAQLGGRVAAGHQSGGSVAGAAGIGGGSVKARRSAAAKAALPYPHPDLIYYSQTRH